MPPQKTLLFHDIFLMKWGAERMNIEIAKILGSDIATAYWSENCYDDRQMGFEWEIFQTNPSFRKGMLGFLMMKWSFYRSSRLVQKYDTVFFSNEAITAIHGVKPGTRTIYYAHSISRHLFDLYDDYLEKVPLIAKIPYMIVAYFLRNLYIAELRRVDVILVNSLKNKNRINEWIGRDDAIVLYPPVDTERFRVLQNDSMTEWQGREVEKNSRVWWIDHVIEGESTSSPVTCHLSLHSYYLSFARLTHTKRVDHIIRAFQQMPDRELVVLYGREDSQREEFIALGDGYENIHFITLSDNSLLPEIIAGAIATIAVGKEEDFGMVVVESLACGVPVIATDEGGHRETMIDGVTGVLISPNDLVEAIRWWVEMMGREKAASMSRDCRDRAMDFSLERMRRELERVMGE